MQYLLTEEEYVKLIKVKKGYADITKENLQRLCIMIAEHYPVTRSWDKANKNPWGCILSDNGKNPGYCDQCPVTLNCPNKNKSFSK